MEEKRTNSFRKTTLLLHCISLWKTWALHTWYTKLTKHTSLLVNYIYIRTCIHTKTKNHNIITKKTKHKKLTQRITDTIIIQYSTTVKDILGTQFQIFYIKLPFMTNNTNEPRVPSSCKALKLHYQFSESMTYTKTSKTPAKAESLCLEKVLIQCFQ